MAGLDAHSAHGRRVTTARVLRRLALAAVVVLVAVVLIMVARAH